MSSGAGVSGARWSSVITDYQSKKGEVSKKGFRGFFGRNNIKANVNVKNYIKNSGKSFLSNVGSSTRKVSRKDITKNQLFLVDDKTLAEDDFSFIEVFLAKKEKISSEEELSERLKDAEKVFERFVDSIPYYVNRANKEDAYQNESTFTELPLSSESQDRKEQQRFFKLFHLLEQAFDSGSLEVSEFALLDRVRNDVSSLLIKILEDTCKHKPDKISISSSDNIFYNLRNISKSIVQISQKCPSISRSLKSAKSYKTVFNRIIKSGNPEEVRLLDKIIKNESNFVESGNDVSRTETHFLFPLLKTLYKKSSSRDFMSVYKNIKSQHRKNLSKINEKEKRFIKYGSKTRRNFIKSVDKKLEKILGYIHSIEQTDDIMANLVKQETLVKNSKEFKKLQYNEKFKWIQKKKIVDYLEKIAPDIKYMQYIYAQHNQKGDELPEDLINIINERTNTFKDFLRLSINTLGIKTLGTIEETLEDILKGISQLRDAWDKSEENKYHLSEISANLPASSSESVVTSMDGTTEKVIDDNQDDTQSLDAVDSTTATPGTENLAIDSEEKKEEEGASVNFTEGSMVASVNAEANKSATSTIASEESKTSSTETGVEIIEDDQEGNKSSDTMRSTVETQYTTVKVTKAEEKKEYEDNTSNNSTAASEDASVNVENDKFAILTSASGGSKTTSTEIGVEIIEDDQEGNKSSDTMRSTVVTPNVVKDTTVKVTKAEEKKAEEGAFASEESEISSTKTNDENREISGTSTVIRSTEGVSEKKDESTVEENSVDDSLSQSNVNADLTSSDKPVSVSIDATIKKDDKVIEDNQDDTQSLDAVDSTTAIPVTEKLATDSEEKKEEENISTNYTAAGDIKVSDNSNMLSSDSETATITSQVQSNAGNITSQLKTEADSKKSPATDEKASSQVVNAEGKTSADSPTTTPPVQTVQGSGGTAKVEEEPKIDTTVSSTEASSATDNSSQAGTDKTKVQLNTPEDISPSDNSAPAPTPAGITQSKTIDNTNTQNPQVTAVETELEKLTHTKMIAEINRLISEELDRVTDDEIEKQTKMIQDDINNKRPIKLASAYVAPGNIVKPQEILGLKDKKGAITNAANAQYRVGKGVCGAIGKAAGHQGKKGNENSGIDMQADCQAQSKEIHEKDTLPIGCCTPSSSHLLEKNGVLFLNHVAAPNIKKSEQYLQNNDVLQVLWLANSYKSTLETAQANPLKTSDYPQFLVTPLLGAAIFGVSPALSVKSFLIATLINEIEGKADLLENYLVLFNSKNAEKLSESHINIIAKLRAAHDRMKKNESYKAIADSKVPSQGANN